VSVNVEPQAGAPSSDTGGQVSSAIFSLEVETAVVQVTDGPQDSETSTLAFQAPVLVAGRSRMTSIPIWPFDW